VTDSIKLTKALSDGKNVWPIITAKVAYTPKSKNSTALPRTTAKMLFLPASGDGVSGA
jgi:hypothetical protein